MHSMIPEQKTPLPVGEFCAVRMASSIGTYVYLLPTCLMLPTPLICRVTEAEP